MRLSLCTISFRHHLVSLDEIARFARDNDFQGIEIWGIHARNASRQPRYGREWAASYGLTVPMVSDYLPTEGDPRETEAKAVALCRLAVHWGAAKIRTFAGGRASADVSQEDTRRVARRLRDIAAIAGDHGLCLLVETHPDTLADSLASTLRLIAEVDHAALKINFDTLHVWEGGDDPLDAHAELSPFIAHYHLKNIRSRDDLSVFAPANVYAAAGRRDGMTPLFEGAFDYVGFLHGLALGREAEASLEWFGNDAFEILAADRREVGRVLASQAAPERAEARRAVARS